MPSDRPDEQRDELDLGVAGASARRELAHRRADRERRTRERHPVVGGVLLAIRDAPAHERVWGTGAGGEEATARYLAERCPDALVLHDRQIPGRTANIDHIAVVPSGVYVIDSKLYKNRKIRVATPLVGSQKLLIDGSDRTKLVDALLRQADVVSEVLSAGRAGRAGPRSFLLHRCGCAAAQHAQHPSARRVKPPAPCETAPPKWTTRPRSHP
jgi:hypothetical protein